MFLDILFTFLISISPFGEARSGIPYGELNGLPILLVFVIGLAANLLIFPLFYRTIEFSKKYFRDFRGGRGVKLQVFAAHRANGER